MGHHHLHHNSSTDGGVSHSSPRFSGAMTRRAHSFKRNPTTTAKDTTTGNNNAANTEGGGFSTQYELDLQMNSPRSEVTGGSSEIGFGGQVTQRAAARFLRKPIEAAEVVEMGLRERKRLGHWMFFAFCGVCLFVGIIKICATGWFGFAIETARGFYEALYVVDHNFREQVQHIEGSFQAALRRESIIPDDEL